MAYKIYFLLCAAIFSFESECFPRNNIIFHDSVKDVFFNPISDEGYFESPNAFLHTDGFYYIPRFNPNSTVRQLVLTKSRKLSSLRDAESVEIYFAGDRFILEPQIYFLDGQFYIYFDNQINFIQQHMYVMKANNPNNPMGGWSTPYRLPLPGTGSIYEMDMDGTVLQYGNGRRYFIWMGFSTEYFGSTLYISLLCNPTLACGERYVLKRIDFPWEQNENGDGVVAAPRVLQHDGRTFVIYSANADTGEDIVYGMMGIDDLKDPLVYDNWWKNDEPVFTRNEEENVFTIGPSFFTTSPDGTESWMLYVARNVSESSVLQTIRIQKITWKSDGTPDFGTAVGLETALESPSGE